MITAENKRKRNPLDKNIGFMKGVREKWCAVFILYSFIILTCQIHFNIDPSIYMNFAIVVGSLFLLGGSVDSFMKIGAARSIKEKELDKPSE
jgi:hypothetical protein